jgi:hypothetical protein
MATQLKLQEIQKEDFQVIRDLGPEKLRKVVDGVRRIQPVPMRPEKLFLTVAESLGENEHAAESVVRQAFMLHGWIRQRGVEVGELQASIREALKADFHWSDKDVEKWNSIEPAFGELLSSPILRLVARAIDLSYEYTNLWREARILTDIRPIFNEEATAVDGAIVAHTFRLYFDCVDGGHELNIAMDESDIQRLAEQCERALRKAGTARDLMVEKAKVPTIISGEGDDAGRD